MSTKSCSGRKVTHTGVYHVDNRWGFITLIRVDGKLRFAEHHWFKTPEEAKRQHAKVVK